MPADLLGLIIEKYPNDAVLARKVFFSMKMIHYANGLAARILHGIEYAEVKTLAKAGEFAEICRSAP
jgi:hypothetical protein